MKSKILELKVLNMNKQINLKTFKSFFQSDEVKEELKALSSLAIGGRQERQT